MSSLSCDRMRLNAILSVLCYCCQLRTAETESRGLKGCNFCFTQIAREASRVSSMPVSYRYRNSVMMFYHHTIFHSTLFLPTVLGCHVKPSPSTIDETWLPSTLTDLTSFSLKAIGSLIWRVRSPVCTCNRHLLGAGLSSQLSCPLLL